MREIAAAVGGAVVRCVGAGLEGGEARGDDGGEGVWLGGVRGVGGVGGVENGGEGRVEWEVEGGFFGGTPRVVGVVGGGIWRVWRGG